MAGLREIVEKSDRYDDFTLLDELIAFKDLLPDEDFDYVQLHSTQVFTLPDGKQDIVGLSEILKREKGIISSLDGDSYCDTFPVLGYEKFTNWTCGVTNGIEVLVGKSW